MAADSLLAYCEKTIAQLEKEFSKPRLNLASFSVVRVDGLCQFVLISSAVFLACLLHVHTGARGKRLVSLTAKCADGRCLLAASGADCHLAPTGPARNVQTLVCLSKL